MTNPFQSLGVLKLAHPTLALPKPYLWRLLVDSDTEERCCHGAINAVAAVHGLAVATNGIQVLLLQDNGGFVLGHYDWFVPYPKASLAEVRTSGGKPRAKQAKSEKQERIEYEYI